MNFLNIFEFEIESRHANFRVVNVKGVVVVVRADRSLAAASSILQELSFEGDGKLRGFTEKVLIFLELCLATLDCDCRLSGQEITHQLFDRKLNEFETLVGVDL